MSRPTIQRKAAPTIFAGEPPAVPPRGAAGQVRARATQWLRERGLMRPYFHTTHPKHRNTP
jgi:hypothetical protein